MNERDLPRALSDEEVELVGTIVERLIPADESGPGAREAQVPRYIDRALATDYAGHRDAYRRGLAAIDAHAISVCGRRFASLPADKQDEVLRRLERQDLEGAPPLFFDLLRQHALEGMFGDPAYGGNADGAGWRLLGYAGPKAVWTAAEQEIETRT